MNELVQEQIQDQKNLIEQEFYKSVRRCACCQRHGEWTKRCSRCHRAYYCSRDCQKWAWEVHKKHCFPPGEAPPEPAEKPARVKVKARREGVFDMTDASLEVSYLEGCGNVECAVA
eukprot:CAMPEP_0119266826 /NCGR_PEP_ID=MMETSP1329-20130426/5181_1 /TAXON_ID=114041 /ORGANISM="Genus nov. species nov., Strain RCC1024" /LENGTH=115 /DNA_ID=CAMNT_0007266725 /DNA_START=133 /DNA_END=476 /DNA_ORIENTATION=-